MYIEFVGTPGSGKTTIARETAELLKASGIHAITKNNFFDPSRKRLYKSLWSIAHLDYLDLDALRFIWRWSKKNNSSIEKFFVRVFEYIKLRYCLRNIESKEIAVWDGGFVQQFANLSISDLEDIKTISDFIKKRLSKDTLLVFVDTPIEEAAIRMIDREAGFERRMNEQLSSIKKAQKELVDSLAVNGLSLAVLNGVSSVEENADIVYKNIRDRMAV